MPATATRHWCNKIKAAPSQFSFPKVSDGANVYEYPKNNDWRKSDRVLGAAANVVNVFEWDRMNARLGPNKRVNVILAYYPTVGDGDSELGKLQENKWLRGKKNDLVICYGGEDSKLALWAYVFGWSESDDVKRNLEKLITSHEVTTELISQIESEISKNYIKKDWHKFDYVSVEPPPWSVVVMSITVFLTQIVGYVISFVNEIRRHT
jgi:hypothetical protein